VSELSDQELATLWAVADVLVPATEGMPALRDADARAEWLDRALAADPGLVDDLQRVLAAIQGGDVSATVRGLFVSVRRDFDVLATVVTGTYYLIPQVRRLIGYPGQSRNPPRLEEAAEQLEDLLEQATSRPSFYRPTPSRPTGP